MGENSLLSLKWSNHSTTFFQMLSCVRRKECYADVTLACDGKFYKVHKLVLSTCSEYFEQMFEQTQCKHPVIVLKDIRSEELESLLSYMYVGEVNVVQEKLSGLIKAAECLRIKGLAVPDEEQSHKTSSSREKRTNDNGINSDPKRRRQEEPGSVFSNRSNVNRNEERRKSSDNSNKFRNSNVNNTSSNSSTIRDESSERSHSAKDSRTSASTTNSQPVLDVKTEETDTLMQGTFDEPSESVKQEPVDIDGVYLSDSNSASEPKDMLMENFGDVQHHFMDELLGQNMNKNEMGVEEFVEGGEGGSSSAGGSQQNVVCDRALNLNENNLNRWSDPSATAPQSAFDPTSLGPNLWGSSTNNSNSGTGSSGQLKFTNYSNACNSTTAGQLKFTNYTNAGNSASSTTTIGQVKFTKKYQISSCSRSSGDQSCTDIPFHQLKLELAPKDPLMKYVCPVCFSEFRQKNDLRRHYMVHSGEKPFLCSFCPYRARQPQSLKAHILTQHNKI